MVIVERYLESQLCRVVVGMMFHLYNMHCFLSKQTRVSWEEEEQNENCWQVIIEQIIAEIRKCLTVSQVHNSASPPNENIVPHQGYIDNLRWSLHGTNGY